MMPSSSHSNGCPFQDVPSHHHNINQAWKKDVVTSHTTSTTEHFDNNRYCDSNNNSMDDDGMYVYREPMLLSEVDSPSDSSTYGAIRTYHNEAQSLISGNHFVEAHQFYVRVLEIIDNAPQSETATTIAHAKFVLHHNLGYCLCKLHHDDTKKRAHQAYHTALQLATKFRPGSYAIATTYYCIGHVTMMKSPTTSSGSGDADDTTSKALLPFHLALQRCETIILQNNECDNHSELVGWIWNHIGRILSCSRDPRNYPLALIAYQNVVSIRRTYCSSDSKLIAASICNLAQAYRLCGMLDCAKRHYNEFLQIAQSSQKYLVDVPPIMSRLAEIHLHEKEYDTAKSIYAQAICVARDVFTKSPLEVATLHTKLGQVHFQLQEFEEALHCYTHALNIQQTALPWNDSQIAVTLMSIGQIHRKLGNHRDAMIRFRQIHSIQIDAFGEHSLEVAAILSSMGLLQFEQRQFVPAYDLFMQVLQIQLRHYGSSNPNMDIAATLSTIGLVVYHTGERVLAKRCFADSLRIRSHMYGPDHRENAILWYNLATIALEANDDEAALEYYKESLRIERCVVHEDNQDAIILSLQHVAVVYQRRGQLDDALEYIHEALICEQSRNAIVNSNNESIGKLLNWMGDVYLHLGRTCSMMECYIQAAHLLSHTTKAPLVDRMKLVGYKLYDLSKIHPPCSSAA